MLNMIGYHVPAHVSRHKDVIRTKCKITERQKTLSFESKVYSRVKENQDELKQDQYSDADLDRESYFSSILQGG